MSSGNSDPPNSGGRKIPLCRRGSGFDAAGLGYLIGKRPEYYVRRQRDRTLMKGDRVAVLGRGIAVVEHVDETEVEALLGDKAIFKDAAQRHRLEPAEHSLGGEGLGSVERHQRTREEREDAKRRRVAVVGHRAAFETKSPGSCLLTTRERLYS